MSDKVHDERQAKVQIQNVVFRTMKSATINQQECDRYVRYTKYKL